MKLEGKVALITDASDRVGRVVAERFANEGARLALNFPVEIRDGGVLQYREKAIADGYYTAAADPVSKAAVYAFVESVIEQYGKIDILIHSNNDVRRLSFEDCTDDDFLECLNVNAKSAFLFTQAVGRRMKDARAGHIVYISSIHDEKPTGCAFAYSVAKGAVQMLMRETAVDLAIYGVCVNVISCGPVEGDDELFESNLTKLYENLTDRIPLRRVGCIEDFASLALYLCGDENRFINGEDIRVDGGFLLNYGTRMNYEEYDALLKEHNGDLEAIRALYAPRR